MGEVSPDWKVIRSLHWCFALRNIARLQSSRHRGRSEDVVEPQPAVLGRVRETGHIRIYRPVAIEIARVEHKPYSLSGRGVQRIDSPLDARRRHADRITEAYGVEITHQQVRLLAEWPEHFQYNRHFLRG